MEEKNELNDIILNRSSSNGGMKKVMLFVAALAVLLIIVVVIMSSLNSGGIANLPKAIEPPGKVLAQNIEEDPLFEPIAIDEESSQNDSLDDVAKKIKEQSEKEEAPVDVIAGPQETLIEEETEVIVPAKYEKPVAKTTPKVKPTKQTKKVVKKPQAKPAIKGNYYVQVGSFGRYAPDKKFLNKITSSGYIYKLHKVGSSTKVLVGPYLTDKKARKDLRAIRNSIEPGAFLSRI